jgi:hypothetical protein
VLHGLFVGLGWGWMGFGVGEVGELFVCGYWEILVLA